MYSGILHASVIVSSTDKALVFYRDILGMEVDEKRPDLGYPGAWVFVAGQQQIHLLELPNPDPVDNRPAHGGRDRHTAIGIENFDTLVASLEQNKINFTLSKSGRKALFCRDPDGNTLEFIKT